MTTAPDTNTTAASSPDAAPQSCPHTGATGTQDAGTIVLDPYVRDLVGEGARLRAAGPLAHVELLGGVRCYAVTHHTEARQLLNDPRLVKDIDHWNAWQRGEIPMDWPLIGLANPGRSMLTVDGPEHRRLRTLVAQALTVRRVERLRGSIEDLTNTLLDGLARHGADEVVDLKAEFAQPLPMKVVTALMGVEGVDGPRMKEVFDRFFSSETEPGEMPRIMAEIDEVFTAVLEEKRAHPADDLTSALLQAGEEGDRLTEEELLNTIKVMIIAGHETTISLLLQAVIGLETHPEQRAMVLSGEVPWENVVEETLRWSTPTSHVLFRYATEDIPVGDTVLPKGEALIVSFGAIGRDERVHGDTAEDFDITRDTVKHIAFGHGPHVCPGAALSRLEAAVALPALYARFPELTLAVPASELRNKPVVTQNDLVDVPVRLGKQA
ncbi:cytochrome P450 family protein [Streptomyces candidus]|uniref:Cytochrome P450 n=1 Tax=Streptomyces candidus TaxID=67283 RepID=A0A7X0LP49_9ACTN|nr:cytochrome P450 [Streptomyces candidus]MBB6435585.1 cytochrome P450 [Streptomyces candidus]GHH46925.1 cytochrome P450 [Streptomyces candidus]